MTLRVEGEATYTQNFDIENRLSSVVVNGQTTAFVYDSDGNLVKKIRPDNTSVVYIGGIYEVELSAGGAVTKKTSYYGVALRVEVVGVSNTLHFVLRDHLGSASVTLDASGNVVTNGEQRYTPFGEPRITGASLPTDRLFTGQREVGLGLYHYGARFYSSALGRFISADSVVPSWTDPQSLNRYLQRRHAPGRREEILQVGRCGHGAFAGGHDSTAALGPRLSSRVETCANHCRSERVRGHPSGARGRGHSVSPAPTHSIAHLKSHACR